MSMKKIAFYVEGQTEMFFLEKLITEIAGQKNIQIELQEFGGKGRPKKTIHPKITTKVQNPQHYALLFNCTSDMGVKSRILEDASSLFSQNYSEIIGLMDLFPRTDLAKLEKSLIEGRERLNERIIPPLPAKTSIVIAVREIEDWFLAECNHYFHIDNLLNDALISASALNFNPRTDDLTTRSCAAAEDLKLIYQLVGKSYDKDIKKVLRTINCLDYSNLYSNIRTKIPKLNELVMNCK